MAKVLPPINPTSPISQHNGKEKNEGPTNDVDDNSQWLLFESKCFHMDKDNKLLITDDIKGFNLSSFKKKTYKCKEALQN